MPNAQSLHASEEKVIYSSYGHWVEFVPALVAAAFLLAAWWILPSLLRLDDPTSLFYIPRYERFGSTSLLLLTLAMTVVLAWLALACLRYLTSEFTITDRRMIARRGLLLREACEVSLHSIEAINLEQSEFGVLFGYGSLVVITSGRACHIVRRVPWPEDFRYRLQAHIARLPPANQA